MEQSEVCVCEGEKGGERMTEECRVTELITTLVGESAACAGILSCPVAGRLQPTQPLSPSVISALLVRKAWEKPQWIKRPVLTVERSGAGSAALCNQIKELKLLKSTSADAVFSGSGNQVSFDDFVVPCTSLIYPPSSSRLSTFASVKSVWFTS